MPILSVEENQRNIMAGMRAQQKAERRIVKILVGLNREQAKGALTNLLALLNDAKEEPTTGQG